MINHNCGWNNYFNTINAVKKIINRINTWCFKPWFKLCDMKNEFKTVLMSLSGKYTCRLEGHVISKEGCCAFDFLFKWRLT